LWCAHNNWITAEPIFGTCYSWIFVLKFANTFQFLLKIKKRDPNFTGRPVFCKHFEAKYFHQSGKLFRTECVKKNHQKQFLYAFSSFRDNESPFLYSVEAKTEQG